MEHYSTIKKNEIMSFAGTWMELKNIMLSKIRQTQKDKCHMFIYKQNLDQEEGREGGREKEEGSGG
jgi:hypothetical protein